MERVLHRRQFVLGPRAVTRLAGWQQIPLGGELVLTAHPELPVCQARRRDLTLTLLGHALDPADPAATNAALVERLADSVPPGGSLDVLAPSVNGLAGRWVLVACCARESRLYLDAGGTRQVYHADPGLAAREGTWCASQPGLIAEELGLHVDPEFLEYLEGRKKAGMRQYWWPGPGSPYAGICLLLPNHDLDLQTGESRRFWPTRARQEVDFEEAVERCASKLQGIVAAAVQRFPIALSLTSGCDSRTILAACRDWMDHVWCYTWTVDSHEGSHRDAEVAERVLRRVGREHHVVRMPSDMQPSFRDVYNKNSLFAHEQWGAWAQGFAEQCPPDHVRFVGSHSDISRGYYSIESRVPEGRLTGRTLGEALWLGSSPVVTRALDRWLDGLKDANGYDLLELLKWEQRAGSWAAMNFTEWDLVQDVVAPFSCHELITTMLQVPSHRRKYPANELHLAMIRRMWPELLEEPINPTPRRGFGLSFSGMASLFRRTLKGSR